MLTKITRRTCIIFFSFLLASCTSNSDQDFTKHVVFRHADGSPRVEHYLANPKDTASAIKEIRYWENGRVEMEGGLNRGNRDGEWLSYRRSGAKWSVMNYKNGFREGLNENWRDNGNRNYIGYYRNDKEHGVWQFFDLNTGKLFKEVYFENGVKIKEENFSEENPL